MGGSTEKGSPESGGRVPKKNNPKWWKHPPLCSKRSGHLTKDHQSWKNTAQQWWGRGWGGSTALLCAGTNASIALVPSEGTADIACLQLLLSTEGSNTSDQATPAWNSVSDSPSITRAQRCGDGILRRCHLGEQKTEGETEQEGAEGRLVSVSGT